MNDNLKKLNHLPHNFLAEKIILSSLLTNPEAIEISLRSLTVESFYFKNHQEIYRAIVFLYQKNHFIDTISLTTFLQNQGLLNEIGGIDFLNDLLNQIADISHLENYIQLVQDKFLRRLLIKLGYKIINSSYTTNIPLEDIFIELETNFLNLTNELEYSETLNNAELFSNIFLELKEKSRDNNLPGLTSGFYDLDSITQGFQKSDLIILAGRPSMGKTALCLNIALNVVKQTKQPVLFLSLEMSKEQLTYRLLSNELEISNTQLRAGHLTETDWSHLNNAIKTLSSLPLFIDDSPNILIQDIRTKIKKIIFEQNQIGLIVIDYLQLMQNSKISSDNRVQELSQITRSLKRIAREFNVPIITLSQLSRNVENRVNKRPILSDLRESGSIEQDADLVLMLYRDSYYNNTEKVDSVELIIAKHRNGPIGAVNLKFDPKSTKFKNY